MSKFIIQYIDKGGYTTFREGVSLRKMVTFFLLDAAFWLSLGALVATWVGKC